MKYTGLLGVSFIFTILILSTSLPYQAVAQKGGPDFIPGRYIVVLQDDVTPNDVARGHGVVPQFVYDKAINGFAGPMSPKAVEGLQDDPRVKYVERDQRVYAFAQTIPTGIDRMDAEPSDLSNLGSDVTIAIIDSGIDLDHPDLNVRTEYSVSCANGGPFGGNCESGGDDDNGHGTHVAGTAAGVNNDEGVVGVAPGADLWAVKVLNHRGSGYMSWIIAGVNYVTDNAGMVDVANMSLGCECSSSALDDAISSSVAAGVTYVVAAGNDDADASTFSPANHPDVITVSALADSNGMCGGGGPNTSYGADDTLATFSNYGSDVEIAAPGVDIYSTLPGGYGTYSGTSMASPHVAGAAALVIVDNPGFSPAQVSSNLVSNGIPQGQACNGDGDGGFSESTGDGSPEPLAYVGNSVTPIEDTTGPTPVIATSENSPTNSDPVSFTIDFGEPIDTTTFDSGDITKSSGSVQSLTNTGDDQNWTFEVASPTDPSTLSVNIGANVLEDTNNNLNSASNIVEVDIDRTASAAPSIDPPTSPTTDNTPTITGTGVSGETITLTSDLDGDVGTTTVLGDTTWSLTTSTLQVGIHSLTATQTDSAGNESPSSSSINLEIEALPGVSVGSIDPPEGSKNTSVDVIITGSGFVAGAQVTLTNGSGPTPSVTDELVSDDKMTITATINIPGGGPPRSILWDITVTNPDSSNDTLIDSFTVNP